MSASQVSGTPLWSLPPATAHFPEPSHPATWKRTAPVQTATRLLWQRRGAETAWGSIPLPFQPQECVFTPNNFTVDSKDHNCFGLFEPENEIEALWGRPPRRLGAEERRPHCLVTLWAGPGGGAAGRTVPMPELTVRQGTHPGPEAAVLCDGAGGGPAGARGSQRTPQAASLGRGRGGLEGSAVSRSFLARPRRVRGVGLRGHTPQRRGPGGGAEAQAGLTLTSCELSGVETLTWPDLERVL